VQILSRMKIFVYYSVGINNWKNQIYNFLKSFICMNYNNIVMNVYARDYLNTLCVIDFNDICFRN